MNKRNTIDALLETYSPNIVVMRRRQSHSPKAADVIRAVADTIRIKARRHSATMEFIRDEGIRRLFEQFGCGTKFEIASVLAQRFDEIAWKLPPKRRPWESEKHNSLLFDSVATGIAFFARTT